MKSFLFLTTVLALSLFCSAENLLQSCNVVNINNVAVFNICPFNNTGPIENEENSGLLQNDNFNWSLVTPQVNGCPNSGNSLVYATVTDLLNNCFEIAGPADPVITPLDSDDEEAGLIFTFQNTSDFGKQLVVQLNCDDTVTGISSSNFNVNSNDTTVIIQGSSNSACPYLSLNMLASFMQKYKWIFLGIFIILGIFICFFGFQTLKVTIFIIALVGGTLISGLIFFQFTSLGTKGWVLWLIFIACLIIGLVLGYVAVKFESVGFVALGMVLGAVAGLFLFNLVLAPFVQGKRYVLYVVCAILGIIGGLIAFKTWKKIVIIATAVIGSYMIVRAISIAAGGFPSEESIASGVAKFSGVTYAYLAAMVVLAILGGYVQFRRQKNDETDEEQNAYERMMGGGNYNGNYGGSY